MIILKIFKVILTFYSLLYNFKHLVTAQDDYFDDDLDDPESENTVFYHVKEATWVTADADDSSGGLLSSKKSLTPSTRRTTSSTSHATTKSPTTTPLRKTSSAKIIRKHHSLITEKITPFLTKTFPKPTSYKKMITTTSSFSNHTETDFEETYPITDAEKENFNEMTQKDYTNYSVLLITPGSIEQLEEMLEFEFKGQDYNFWSHRRVFDAPLIVVLPPTDTNLRNSLRQHKIDYIILIENLESVLEQERDNFRKQIPPSLTGISFNMYLRYDFVMDYLNHLSEKYSEITRLIKIGKTVEERDITVLEVKGREPYEKIIGAVFIQAGMHGREWLGVSTALYVINQLVEHAAANKNMFDGIFWYILPIFNADGYEYSHTTDRLWKNNRRQYENGTGIDLDRNFEIGDFKTSRKKLPSTNLYTGAKPGSEPETRALQRFLKKTKKIIKVYISLHSGDPFIGYPWAYKSERSTDYEQIVDLATHIKSAIEAKDNSTFYKVDRLYALCGKYDGAAIDWAKREGILYPLMVSLKGGAYEGFDVSSEDIFDAVVAAYEGIKAIANHLQLYVPKDVTIVIQEREDSFANNLNIIKFPVLGFFIWLIISFLI